MLLPARSSRPRNRDRSSPGEPNSPNLDSLVRRLDSTNLREPTPAPPLNGELRGAAPRPPPRLAVRPQADRPKRTGSHHRWRIGRALRPVWETRMGRRNHVRVAVYLQGSILMVLAVPVKRCCAWHGQHNETASVKRNIRYVEFVPSIALNIAPCPLASFGTCAAASW